MRPIYIFSLLTFLAFVSSCGDKVRMFNKQTDVARAGLKGKVRSVVWYHCTLDSSAKYCSIYRTEYNKQGFLTARTETRGSEIDSYKYYYNKDGLRIKRVFTPSLDILPSTEETYTYSFSDRKKTTVFSETYPGLVSIDTMVTIYDIDGSEIEYNSKTLWKSNEYDKHGFLVLERSVSQTDPKRHV
jgi:hypothetical protein